MRILFIAPQDSIHTARWICQLSDQEWKIHIFPSTLPGELHPALKDKGIKVHFPRLLRLLLRFFRRLARDGARFQSFLADPLPISAWWLSRVIHQVNPDIIHTLEFQHAGYLYCASRNYTENKKHAWIATNWGSDIFLFGQLPSHIPRIREILETCDYYSCECERDLKLAFDMGLKGTPLPVLPNAGGFAIDLVTQFREPGKTSSRRVIVLKGYQHWAGRALVGLRAIELCADALEGYKVVIPIASPDVAPAAELLAQKTGLSIDILSAMSHEEILKIYGSARIYIGLSISDAISQSMLEAIVMGAFPIQSDTACADEWLVDGVNGLIVPPENPETVAKAIHHALIEDQLVDTAAELNWQLAKDRLDEKVIQPQVIAMYERIWQESDHHQK